MDITKNEKIFQVVMIALILLATVCFKLKSKNAENKKQHFENMLKQQ